MLKELLKTSHVTNLGRNFGDYAPDKQSGILLLNRSSPNHLPPISPTLSVWILQSLDLKPWTYVRICTCGSELFVATNHSHDAQVCGNAEGARRFKGKIEGLLHQDFYHYTLRADSFWCKILSISFPSQQRNARTPPRTPSDHGPSPKWLLIEQILHDVYSWDLGQDDPRKHHMKVQARCHYHSLLSAPANVSTHPQLLDTDTVDDATMCKLVVFHIALCVRCQTGGTNAMMCDCGASWVVRNPSTFW